MSKSPFDSRARKAIAASLDRDGFAVIDFPESKLERMADNICQSLDYLYDWAGWKAGTVTNLRLPDAWQFNKNVRRIATNPAIITLLSDLYGRRAFPFQTLNFAVGSQQHIHADLVHFCSRPPRFMCGVWLALEDVQEGAGPLLYYPGSHKWPVILPEDIGAPLASKEDPYEHYRLLEKAWEAQIAERGAQAVQFLPKKGQAMIWDANLWHGGARQTDMSLTRHSQVTHYFFEGCSYWTPLTGLDRQPVAIEPPPQSAAPAPKRRYLGIWKRG